MHAIEVQGLSKKYGEFVALNDISFKVEAGTTLGLIGRNGAGKSTILSILSGITKPSSGKVVLNGRVASILEVGTGFHPDLTGRENVFMKGHLLGMERSQIMAKFDDIIHFSELEQFIDLPVKNYSSGMYLRLAFSVFAHLDSDIVLLDEVMAVGDAGFQLKSAKKIQDLARSGVTIIIANHDVESIMNICDSALYLRSGKLAFQGNAVEVVANYYETEGLLGTGSPTQSFERDADPIITSDRSIKIFKASVRGINPDPKDHSIDMDSLIEIEFELGKMTNTDEHDIVLRLDNVTGQVVLQDSPLFHQLTKCHLIDTGTYNLSATIPSKLLNYGTYYLSVFVSRNKKNPELFEHILKFEVKRTTFEANGTWDLKNALIRPHLNWKMRSLS